MEKPASVRYILKVSNFQNVKPCLQASLQSHGLKHMSSSLALAIALPSLVEDYGDARTDRLDRQVAQ